MVHNLMDKNDEQRQLKWNLPADLPTRLKKKLTIIVNNKGAALDVLLSANKINKNNC